MAKEEKYFLKEHQRTVKGYPGGKKLHNTVAQKYGIKEKATLQILRIWPNIKP